MTARGDGDIAAIGALVADPARCRILLAPGDGRALPASRLASEAGVSAATASSHLRKLTDGGLLTVGAYERHRYFRLAGAEVAELVEALERIARAAIRVPATVATSTTSSRMRAGRSSATSV